MATPFAAAAARVRDGADPHVEARALVAAMTREEKLGCLDGDTPFWQGLIDGIQGGYYEHPYPAAAVPRRRPRARVQRRAARRRVGHATAFPVSMARGATFDPALEEEIGEAIGRELRAVGATFYGGVCVNLLRHPGWGRAQETYGEDPHHVGEMGAALARGVQRHAMACVKHFACNSIANARFKVDVVAGDARRTGSPAALARRARRRRA
jgi:beta-glucosidase